MWKKNLEYQKSLIWINLYGVRFVASVNITDLTHSFWLLPRRFSLFTFKEDKEEATGLSLGWCLSLILRLVSLLFAEDVVWFAVSVLYLTIYLLTSACGHKIWVTSFLINQFPLQDGSVQPVERSQMSWFTYLLSLPPGRFQACPTGRPWHTPSYNTWHPSQGARKGCWGEGCTGILAKKILIYSLLHSVTTFFEIGVYSALLKPIHPAAWYHHRSDMTEEIIDTVLGLSFTLRGASCSNWILCFSFS